MKLVVNPPTPWPNWKAPVSTRKTRPTIMERAVEGKAGRGECGFPAEVARRLTGRMNEISRKPAHTVTELASARQHQENPADHHGARGGG